MHFFGLLMELEDFTILALSVLLIRFVFVIWTLFDNIAISDFHVVVLIAFTILYGLFSKSIKNLVFESFNSFTLYFALLASRVLTNYLIEVRYEWYVFTGDILLNDVNKTVSITFDVEWTDGTGETMDNEDDTEASKDGTTSFDINVNFVQKR